MDADASGATHDYSSRSASIEAPQTPGIRSRPAVSRIGALLALVAVTGAFLLVLATFTTVVQIRVLTTSDLAGQDTEISGGELHGIALVVVALVALVMLAGALRGVRPAMMALAATGLLGLGVVIGLDAPELDNAGPVARLYENVSAGASTGFYCETVGGVLIMLAGGGLLVLRGKASASDEPRASAEDLGDQRRRRPRGDRRAPGR